MSFNNQLDTNTTSTSSSNAYNSIYDMRMNDFYNNYLSPSNDSTQDLPMPPKVPLNFGLDESSWLGVNQNLNLSHIHNNSPYMNRTTNYSAAILSQQDSSLFSSLQDTSNTSSPFIFNRTKPAVFNKHLQVKSTLQFQSTPNKVSNKSELQIPIILVNNKKANFHNIDDLAKSSSDSLTEVTDQSSGYSSSCHETSNNTTNSTNSSSNKVNSFNENLKQFAKFKLENKENNEFIYKVS